MNYFVENERENNLEEEHLTISGPSKSSQKPKKETFMRELDDTELGNSLLNFNMKNDPIAKAEKEKYKNKSNGRYKTSVNANIKQLLSDRLKMYNIAEENARKTGEIKKIRQLNRSVQILNALIGHHDSGNIIDPNNIPPTIKTSKHNSKSTNPHIGVTFKESAEITIISRNGDLDSISSSNTESEANLEKVLGTLRLRRDQYKISVAQNKSAGNVPRALEYLNIIKMFDSVIRHLEMGDIVDLDELPGPPEYAICHINSNEKNYQHTEIQNVTETISEASEEVISHSTILQSLQQRLKVYEILKTNAKKENNLGQVLRLERIINIYKEAIKLHRARKNFPIHDLPSPPGYAPIGNLKPTKKDPAKI